jgi:GDP-4-dehydro-6-deoxy-D-mannose reductase
LDDPSSVGTLIGRLRPRVIFHLAGTTRPGPWTVLFRDHVQATAALLEAVRSRSPETRVVTVGSAAEYGAGPTGARRLTEASPTRPETDYGRSKRLQTEVALAYASFGVPVVVARLFNVIGAGAPRGFAVPDFLAQLLRAPSRRRSLLRVGPLSSVRDFLSVDDVCDALIALGRAGRPGRVYNVCSGRGVTIGELFRAMAEASGKPVEWREAPLPPGRSTPSRCVGDPGRILRDTGWRPRADALEAARCLVAGR